MTTEAFMVLWDDLVLRQWIINRARGFSRRDVIREELVQEAWLWISTAPCGHERSCYVELADTAMRSAHRMYAKEMRSAKDQDVTDYKETYYNRLAHNLAMPPILHPAHQTPMRNTSDGHHPLLEDDGPKKGWRG